MNASGLLRVSTVLPIGALLILSGCGGGGSSAIRPDLPDQPVDPGPPMQAMSPLSLGQITQSIDNPSAQDLLEHWNDPDVLREATEISQLSENAISARIATLKSIFQAPVTRLDQSRTLLRNVDAEAVTVIGARGGITYGQWKGGPAGSLDIDFDYRFAPELDESERAYIERAGKSWSWRLADDFGTHTVPAGQLVDRGRVIGGISVDELRLDQAVTMDGLTIFVDRHDGTAWSNGNWMDFRSDVRAQNDFEPSLGSIRLGKHRFDQVSNRGNFDLVSIIAHEIGHALGISLGNNNIPFYDALVDEVEGTFNGPSAVVANGGDPVPFQWLDANRQPVEPGTSGASIDDAHLGPCTSVMSYCRFDNDLYAPSELDFAFLEDIGYDVRNAGTVLEPEVYGFGAWGRYSSWGAGVERTIAYEQRRSGNIHNVVAHDTFRAGADAFGVAPGVDFAVAHQGVGGSVSWSGSLLGVDLGQRMLPPVFGDAELNVELSDLTGTARFDNLTVVVDGMASAFRAPQIEYSFDVTGNTFADDGGRIAGGFFGPAHEEMAGVLNDRSAGVNLLAGFGGAQ